MHNSRDKYTGGEEKSGYSFNRGETEREFDWRCV